MDIISFSKYSPCGNMTVFMPQSALGAEYNAARRAALCAEVIAEHHVGAEQAGLIDCDAAMPVLDMMGGEFCLNASRAFAVELFVQGKLAPVDLGVEHDAQAAGQKQQIYGGTITVSGCDTPLSVRVLAQDVSIFNAAVRLQEKAMPRCERVAEGIFCVYLQGITHLVLDAALHAVPRNSEEAWTRCMELMSRYNLQNCDAAGCIWLQEVAATQAEKQAPKQGAGKTAECAEEAPLCHRNIVPYVWVKATKSLCAESSCGSGTVAAFCVCRALGNTEKSLAFRQNGGEILTITEGESIAPQGQMTAPALSASQLSTLDIWVSGTVRLVARGELFVESL